MFGILKNSAKIGVVTTPYPEAAAEVSTRARGKPAMDFEHWRDARAAAQICPTGAISRADTSSECTVTFDLAKCVFCGLCAEADHTIRMTNQCELASRRRQDLVTRATYALGKDGSQERFLRIEAPQISSPANAVAQVEAIGKAIQERAAKLFGRSLHIREVDAGSCNGCEMEIVGLNSPIYDAERFGVHFVASPRHADMLLVTGPVTRNMELALRKTYDATPDPRPGVAVGACGCSGGIFGRNYATLGAVDQVIPVDVYVPGCPPNPFALLHGIMLAMGRVEESGSHKTL